MQTILAMFRVTPRRSDARAYAFVRFAAVTLILSLAHARSAAASNVRAATRAESSTRVLASIPADGDSLRIVATYLHAAASGSREESTIRIRALDGRGRVVWSEAQPDPQLSPNGVIEFGVAVSASPLTIGAARGLVLQRSFDAGSQFVGVPERVCRYLVVRGRKLTALTPWCSVCGDPRPDGRILAEHWTGSVRVLVPVRLRDTPASGGLDLTPEIDARSGMAVLDARVERQEQAPSSPSDSLRRVFLYAAPVGPQGEFVRVDPELPIQFGRAYGKVRIEATVERWRSPMPGNPSTRDHAWPVSRVAVDGLRLEVTIGERSGFVAEDDLGLLGVEAEE